MLQATAAARRTRTSGRGGRACAAAGATPETAQLGLIGLGVMGENLALNIDDHGYRVALWTHTEGKVQRFIDTGGAGRPWVGIRTLDELAAALSPPRRILLMVKAGEPVDELLDRLAPWLAPGDVVIDGGNKLTLTPQRRAQLKLQGQYMGYMRQLKPKQKALARAAKEKGGYRAGIKKARELAGRTA